MRRPLNWIRHIMVLIHSHIKFWWLHLGLCMHLSRYMHIVKHIKLFLSLPVLNFVRFSLCMLFSVYLIILNIINVITKSCGLIEKVRQSRNGIFPETSGEIIIISKYNLATKVLWALLLDTMKLVFASKSWDSYQEKWFISFLQMFFFDNTARRYLLHSLLVKLKNFVS